MLYVIITFILVSISFKAGIVYANSKTFILLSKKEELEHKIGLKIGMIEKNGLKDDFSIFLSEKEESQTLEDLNLLVDSFIEEKVEQHKVLQLISGRKNYNYLLK